MVSHQLPIWITRLHAEGRRFLHDPRAPALHAVQPDLVHPPGDRLVSVGYSKLGRRHDPGRGAPRHLSPLGGDRCLPGWPRRRRLGPVRFLRVRAPVRFVLAVLLLVAGASLSACGGSGTGDKGYVDGEGIITRLPVAERRKPGTRLRQDAGRSQARPRSVRRPGRRAQRVGVLVPTVPQRGHQPSPPPVATSPSRASPSWGSTPRTPAPTRARPSSATTTCPTPRSTTPRAAPSSPSTAP